jgi:2',3'-cyclic-nucleotide 2'-phosphodiesterase (5'-nucleotidase family)
VALFYSTDVLAAIEPCNCPGQPLGGLARRASQIARARAEADAVVVLDAGDLLLPTAAQMPGASGKRDVDRRAGLVAAAYQRIGITALAPGDRDLALGLPLLRRLAKDAQLPLVSANLVGRDGKRLFDADRVVDAAGVRIGVFGVTAPPTAADAQAWKAAGIDARDPVAAARDAVASLRARGAAIVIALVHVGDAPASRRWAEAVPGLDWAVIGHAGLRSETLEKAGSARLLATVPEGKELGRMDLHVVGRAVDFVDRGERAELEAVVADHRRQLDTRDQPIGDLDPASLRDYYESRRKQLEAAIAREQAALARLPTTITGSWFENRLLALDPQTPDDPAVAALIRGTARKRPTVAPSPPPPPL